MVDHLGERRHLGRNEVIEREWEVTFDRFVEHRHRAAVPAANGIEAADVTELVEDGHEARKIKRIEQYRKIHEYDP